MTDSNASRIRSLTEAANSISNPITEARTSPKEQEWANTHANLMREWFSHMSNQNVVDIFKIIKTKDYSAANMKKLKTYLMDAGITDRMGMVRPAKYQKPLDDIGALRSDETAVAIIKAGWDYFAARARPAAAAIHAANETASKNSPKVEEVEDVQEGVLGNVAKKITQKIKDLKSDYLEWRDLAKQLTQAKKERTGVLSDQQIWAQGRLKELDAQWEKAMQVQRRIQELNAELNRLNATDAELNRSSPNRLPAFASRAGKAIKEEVNEVETVEEAVKIDRNMNIKEMAAVLMDIADALMGKNVVTQRERLIAVAQALASKRGFV